MALIPFKNPCSDSVFTASSDFISVLFINRKALYTQKIEGASTDTYKITLEKALIACLQRPLGIPSNEQHWDMILNVFQKYRCRNQYRCHMYHHQFFARLAECA